MSTLAETYPSRVRIVVDEDSGQNQRGLIWSIRGKHYDSAATAQSAYEAEALQTLDTAAKTAKAGASGGTVVTHGTISTDWTPVVGGRIGGTSYPTHTGTNRFYARVLSSSGTAVDARLVYDVGDLVNPVENNPVTLYDGGTFHVLDLGEARLDPPPIGMHRWDWQVQARGQAGTESFSVDRVWVVNQDEAAGVLQAPITPTSNFTSYAARSDFTNESGAITGDSLTVGGVWVGAGDADDFSAGSGAATRTATSDAANTGRWVTVDTNLTNSVVEVDVSHSDANASMGAAMKVGVVARYADTSNHVRAVLRRAASGATRAQLRVEKRVAGTITALIDWTEVLSSAQFISAVRLSLRVFSSGEWSVAIDGTTVVSGSDSALATGGALASGDVGLYDEYTSASGLTRTYDNFASWAPSVDAVVYANQSAELSTGGMYREDSGGTAYGPVSIVSGDLPRMPNQSSGGTVEFLVKPSRGDLSTLPDAGIDDLSVRVYRRKSWLTISGS